MPAGVLQWVLASGSGLTVLSGSGAPRFRDTSPLNLMVAPGLPGALKIAKPFVPAPGPAWHWSLVGSSLVTIDSPLRWAPLLSGLPANAPVAAAVAAASVTAMPPVITLRKVIHLLRHRPVR